MEQQPKLVHSAVQYERISTEEALRHPAKQYEQTLENLNRQLTNTLTVLTKLVKDLATCHPEDEASIEKGIQHETMCLIGFKSIIRAAKEQQVELTRHAAECFECRRTGATETDESAVPAINEQYLNLKTVDLEISTIQLHIKEWSAMDMHDFEINLMRNHDSYGLLGFELFDLCIDNMTDFTIAQMQAKVAHLKNQELAKLVEQRLQASLARRQISIS